MGIFDFIKGAGEKVGVKDKEAQETEASQEAVMSGKLRRHLQSLGLQIESVNVAFDDGVATIKGKAVSQAEREKAILALGNTQGVSRVVDNMTVGAPAPEAKFYTVVKGDTLSKIAKAQYGDAMKYPAIFEANKPMLSDPNKIYPGQVLRIPPLS
jgi:nucleoid-associated protein YgaU